MLGTSDAKEFGPVSVVGGRTKFLVNGPVDKHFNELAHPAVIGTEKGSSVVTPKGPLIPNPALGDNSLKYSPRS
jgi:hypothetical protein